MPWPQVSLHPQPILRNTKISHPPYLRRWWEEKSSNFSSHSPLKHHPFPYNSCLAQACLAPIAQYPPPAFSPYSHHLLRPTSPRSCCYQPPHNFDKGACPAAILLLSWVWRAQGSVWKSSESSCSNQRQHYLSLSGTWGKKISRAVVCRKDNFNHIIYVP